MLHSIMVTGLWSPSRYDKVADVCRALGIDAEPQFIQASSTGLVFHVWRLTHYNKDFLRLAIKAVTDDEKFAESYQFRDQLQ